MKVYYNKHQGQRGFIIANGNSLNDIDVTLMKNDVVIALNRGYLKEGLPITYLVVCNDLVEKQFGNEILKVRCKDIFSNSLPGTQRLHWTSDIPRFQPDASKPIWQGHTVTFVAMQLAYYMGMNPVYVVGLDHYYDQSGSVKKRGRGIVSEGDDPNHFHKEYFGKGIRWDPPNLRMSEKAYRLARTYYNAHHRQLWNATEKTALSEDILPKIKYESLFDV